MFYKDVLTSSQSDPLHKILECQSRNIKILILGSELDQKLFSDSHVTKKYKRMLF